MRELEDSEDADSDDSSSLLLLLLVLEELLFDAEMRSSTGDAEPDSVVADCVGTD